MDVDPDESKHRDTERQHKAEKIIGVTNSGGSLIFLVKFKGMDEAELVPAEEANTKFPQVVIAYFEKSLIWS